MGITDRDELMQNYEEASSGHSFLFSKFLLKEKNEFIITFLYFKKSNLLIHLESRELSKIADKLLFLQDYFPVFFPPLSPFLSWCVVFICTGS